MWRRECLVLLGAVMVWLGVGGRKSAADGCATFYKMWRKFWGGLHSHFMKSECRGGDKKRPRTKRIRGPRLTWKFVKTGRSLYVLFYPI